MSEHPPQHGTAEIYLHEENERIIGSMYNAEKLEDIEKFNERLRQRFHIIESYEKGETPTYTSYANIIDSLLTKSEGIEDPSVEAKRKLAEGRVREMRSSIRRYIANVTRFQHIKIQALRDAEKFKERHMAIDSDRRRSHDALIDTLRTTGRVIAELQKAIKNETGEVGAKIRGYPSRTGDKDGEFIFDSSFLDDRNRVRDWAIAAWSTEQVAEAKKKAAEQAGS